MSEHTAENAAALASTAEDCGRCGGRNVVWFVPSPLWNKVMRGDDINGAPIYGDCVCVTCFVILANEAGINPTRWRLTADPEPEGLTYVTPSGRVWDAERFLWVTPPTEPEDLVPDAENEYRWCCRRCQDMAGDACWCDGPDCGKSPCVEVSRSARVTPPATTERSQP